MSRIKAYAKKTLLAQKDPGRAVEHVFCGALDAIEDDNDTRYLGVKNVRQIPASFVHELENAGFVLHTLDKHSHNGRAVDYVLANPITGKPMTGSSSGTALNVFYGINDLGVGTDGGGSVLAPAMAVNCFGFISPLLACEHMKQYTKKSTDNIEFYPSLGFITRDLPTMEKAIRATLELPEPKEPIVIHAPQGLVDSLPEASRRTLVDAGLAIEAVTMPEFGNERQPMIEFLTKEIAACDVFLGFDAKVDFYGLGDTVLGHFDAEIEALQNKSGKTLLRVANMVKASALTVPGPELSSGFTLFCASNPEKIADMLAVAKRLACAPDPLLERYFRDPDAYFEKGFVWNH